MSTAPVQETSPKYRMVPGVHPITGESVGLIRQGGVPVPGPGFTKEKRAEKTAAQVLQAEIEKQVQARAKKIVNGQAAAAESGSTPAFNALADRTIGPVAQTFRVNRTDTLRVELGADAIMLAAKLLEAGSLDAIDAEFTELEDAQVSGDL